MDTVNLSKAKTAIQRASDVTYGKQAPSTFLHIHVAGILEIGIVTSMYVQLIICGALRCWICAAA